MFKFLKQPTQLICQINVRQFSASVFNLNQKPNSTPLYKLRKATGYGLSKCKAALEKHEDNVEEATKWLNSEAQKEGWEKAHKVKDRATSQGTLVLVNDKSLHRASILELNCETDFVARSEKFLTISSLLAKSVIQNAEAIGMKKVLYKDELNKLSIVNDPSITIADQMALAIGMLGENMSVRRAVVFNVEPGQYLSWYVHGSNLAAIDQCHFGKYGALVNMSFSEQSGDYQHFDIGRQVCQHIVGLKPQSLGELPEPPVSADLNVEALKFSDDESRLLHQEFLMKQNVRVLDFLAEHKATVNDFVRFECGEVTVNELQNHNNE